MRERYNGGITGDVLSDEALSWLYVLARGYADEREVEMMRMEMPSIEEFSRLYGIALDDPEIEKRYDRHHEAVMEYNSEMKYQERLRREGREQGLAEGHEAGLAEGHKAGLAEGLAEGREQGLAEGRETGLAEGREQASGRIADKLRELGADEEMIAQALAAAQEEQ